MTWLLIFEKSPERFLRSRPRHVQERLVAAFEKLSEEPFRFLKHFEGTGYKFRVGDYRAIVRVDIARRVLRVHVLGHRRNIYQ
jgi:mRNA interferase RelE/StbE